MGSELQVKYQKLAQEYAKVELRTKDQALRKHAQENESLSFRNQQLSKRVSTLQDDLESSAKGKKKKDHGGMLLPDVQGEELAAKIAENEQLHSKMFEMNQKSQKLTAQLKDRIATLEQEVANNDALISEINKESTLRYEQVEEEKIVLIAKVEKLTEELKQSRMMTPTVRTDTTPQSIKDKDVLSLNVSNIGKGADSKQSVVLNAVKGLVMEFLDHLPSFSSYLQQVF
ncbi:PREDICTED: protein phosphatase 1 regulatory subunit 21-like [Amphimedon queenslandica]|uniref:Protein phosphatase 1 regulatory subunit 21 N-terminal domain-containing protein n=1 Tax=Amphimedon queenslandica TaxID=400682 RepID=A0AAN0JHH7_AMPQE|nr:PREDICTED: protein phosphatase 1 regulatory subunit 21-like [Amphimedon queenslandica]|eukprot:XP_019856424.1 PREDICTED: protein phosphatase 1 regulatory subunit 21-like [Amphimedon queenslandica]